jgi:MoxR-like ATPase
MRKFDSFCCIPSCIAYIEPIALLTATQTNKENTMRAKTAETVTLICNAARAASLPNPCRRDDLVRVAASLSVNFNDAAFASRKVGRGEFDISDTNPTAPAPQEALEATPDSTYNLARNVESVEHKIDHADLVPAKIGSYIPFGNFDIVKKIVKQGGFFPTYITGLSGNGKTTMIEQVCNEMNRECIRVNITAQTDEDDLLGGFRLVNGETVWQDGPVVIAMQRGAILILDEVDLASHKIMCLQPVLEGRGIYLKKVNRKVLPSAGFNVFATANTKGQGGDNSERFAGTTILNEAFLERFRITIEQDYPPIAVEKKIVKAIMRECDAVDDVYADALCKWADIIRKSYRDGATTEMISTRRLEHIVHAFGIFKDRVEAIRYCVARFPADVRDAFLSLYEKIDATVVVKQAEPEATPAPATTSAKVNAEIPATTTPTSVDSLMAEIKAMMDNAVSQSNGASYALNA